MEILIQIILAQTKSLLEIKKHMCILVHIPLPITSTFQVYFQTQTFKTANHSEVVL